MTRHVHSKQRELDWPLPSSPEGYEPLLAEIQRRPPEEGDALLRVTGINDFWFFLRHISRFGDYLCDDPDIEWYGKPWADHPWVFAFARMIQASPDGHLDLAPRFHFKSTLITQYLTLWDLIDNPDLRIAIITYKLKGTGEGFIGSIKSEAESNEVMKRLYPETFWQNPEREAKIWSLNQLMFRRKSAAKEASVVVAGLTGGSLTSQHYDIRVYDDIVVEQSILTEGAIEATTGAWRSLSGTAASYTRDRYVGTRWAKNDSYKEVLASGVVTARIQDLFDDAGVPVLRSMEWVRKQQAVMTPEMFACQMRNAPSGGRAKWLLPRDLTVADKVERPKNAAVYIMIDPASERKEDSDYTTIIVWAVGRLSTGGAGHRTILDVVWDKMSLDQYLDVLFELVKKHSPVQKVFVEKFGAQRDHEMIAREQGPRGLSFRVQPVTSKVPKGDRIRRLPFYLSQKLIILPRSIIRGQMFSGRQLDMALELRRQLLDWEPTSTDHDDLVDALAWIVAPEMPAKPLPPTTTAPSKVPHADPWAN